MVGIDALQGVMGPGEVVSESPYLGLYEMVAVQQRMHYLAAAASSVSDFSGPHSLQCPVGIYLFIASSPPAPSRMTNS